MGPREWVLLALLVGFCILFGWAIWLAYRDWKRTDEEEQEFQAWSDKNGVNRVPERR